MVSRDPGPRVVPRTRRDQGAESAVEISSGAGHDPGRNAGQSSLRAPLDAKAYREDLRLGFSRPGKPTDDAHVESFNSRLCAKCLSAHIFESLDDAEEALTCSRCDSNAARPHSALGMLTATEFAELGQRNLGH